MNVDHEVRELADLNLEGLREAWRRRYGAPPKLRSVELVRRLLAWRIQVEAYGGIDEVLRRRIERVANGPEHRLPSGARLIRVWKGKRFEVEVDAGGFLFEGKRYTSLSQIARVITGTRWNGPRFFGMRNEEAA